ncbi:MAG: M23 family metallopeptidase [Acetobacteraceae bacterium]
MAQTPCSARHPFLLLFPLLCLTLVSSWSAEAESLAIPSTALLVTPLNQPHVVRGDDGRDHVEYDLLVTNAFASPVTVMAVEVSGPGGAVIGRIDGATLAAATQGVLEQAPIAAIPASGSATVEIDLILPPGRRPPRVSHRITYGMPGASEHTLAIVGSREIQGPVLTVSPFRAITVQPPVRGAGWAAFNGCCTPNPHRNVRVAAGTRIGTAETFAIDFLRVDGNRFYEGDGKSNAQYPFFGAPVHAAAAGIVVARHDGMDESIPFQPATTLHKPEDFGGNYVLVRQAEGVYAFYAHLQKGSVKVAVGQRVAAGAVIGKLGNSGNSSNPHLHFGLLDRPDFLTGYSLPFVFADFMLSGHITGGDDSGALQIQPDVRRVRAAYPLVGAIATYR